MPKDVTTQPQAVSSWRPTNVKNNQGFTLVELMVSIVLGLLISAAAIQLFITGQTVLSTQQAGADVQDNGGFGIEVLSRSIRLANYNNSTPLINDTTPWGGVVITSSPVNKSDGTNVIGNLEAIGIGTTAVKDGLLSHSGDGESVSNTTNEWKGLTNVLLDAGGSIGSDQLVVQYQAPQDMYDCEGNTVKGPRTIKSLTNDTPIAAGETGVVVGGDYVIERYFLRVDTINNSAEPNQALALACDAGRYKRQDPSLESTNAIVMNNYGDAGQIIMNRVDHFHFLLGILNASGKMSYVSVKDYKTLLADSTGKRPRIVSIQAAVLVRSMNSTQSSLVDTASQRYFMLDQNVKMKTGTDKFLRKVYAVTATLRNGLGVDPS